METSKKSGKTAITKKEVSASEREMWRPGRRSLTDLDPALQAELDQQGFTCRWINAKEYYRRGNMHPSGWRPYKPLKDGAFGSADFTYGRSPEGYIQRGDMILGYMPTWAADELRDQNRDRARRQEGINKKQAAELREDLRRAGVQGNISEGYED